MKPHRYLLLLAAAGLLAGCQSYPTDRIAQRQADFNTWPPYVQQEVRAGQVNVGFTPEQVWVALGDPTSKSLAGPPGNVTEVWVYHRHAPRFGFAIGGASVGRGSAVGGGVAVNGMKLGIDVDGEVVFYNGHVTSVNLYTH